MNNFPDRKADDEFLWLEDIYGDAALDWVAAQNARTLQMLGTPSFERTYRRVLEVLDSTDRIPDVVKRGAFLYNFWKDATHPRGLWRRTTLASFRTDSPDWETLLDVDELGRTDQVPWVFAGAQLLRPEFTRALIRLSPDGGDAVSVREYDLATRAFVADGFALPHAKSSVSWVDQDTVLVATDFGPGTLTTSSYPRQVRRWRRGQRPDSAAIELEVPVEHMAAMGWHDATVGYERDLLREAIAFFTRRTWLVRDGARIQIEVPNDANVDLHRQWMLVRTKSEWNVGAARHPAGALLAIEVDAFIAGDRAFDVLFTPDARTSLQGWSWTLNHLLINVLRDVSSEIRVLTPGANRWSSSTLAAAPAYHTVSATGVDADENDDYWLNVNGFIQPATLQLGTVGAADVETLKSAPAFFAASGFAVEQHFVASDDGTRVPYFQISPSGSEARRLQSDAAARLRRIRDFADSAIRRRERPLVAGARRGDGRREHPRRRRVRSELAHIGAARESAPSVRGFRRDRARPDRAWCDFCSATRMRWGQQRWSAGRQHVDALSGTLRRDRLRRSAARHEALHETLGRILVDRGVRRP